MVNCTMAGKRESACEEVHVRFYEILFVYLNCSGHVSLVSLVHIHANRLAHHLAFGMQRSRFCA